jgi:threonine dehydrogenase-like Zn-dependent dehydrogenase
LEVARDLTGGRGVDVCFEAAAVPASLSEGIEAVRHRGRVVMVGVHAASARLNLELYRFHRRELSIVSIWGAWGAFDRTANWLVELNLRPIVSHFYGLDQIEAAFDKARSPDAIKVLVGAGVAES